MNPEFDDLHDDGIESLLREVGPRQLPSAAAMSDVQQAVHAEWQATVTRRKRRRRLTALATAASLVLAVAVGWTLRFTSSPPDIAVTIAHVSTPNGSASPSGRRLPLVRGASVRVGSLIETDADTRIALDYGTRVSLRIDRESSLERVARDRFRLNGGAIYIDALPQGHDNLIIETRAGDVRHLGTQYLVRQAADTVEISAREGRVEVTRATGAALVSAGERIRIAANGSIERGAISSQDPVWDWAEATSPAFAIEERTLAEFLEWVARETGREVAYASAEAQRAAATVKLHGSIDGLAPDTALAAVLATTGFATYTSSDNVIGVRFTEDANQ
jgi:ferric-dicitrate binding protein FerR (iron transport regulator)